MKRSIAAFSLSLALAQSAYCQVSFGGGLSYSQDFDTLATSGNANAWSQNTTIGGWYLFQYTGGNIADINAGPGSSNSGHFWSFGTGTATERALGGVASANTYFGSPGPASGAVAGYIAVGLQNTSGSTLDSFTISYDGEQWRDGGATTPVAQTMVLQYGFGATYAGVTTWNVPAGNFDFTSPVFVNTTTGAAVDGNAAGKVTARGGTISSLAWNNSETLWVRWLENNDAGNDHGLAIDNFSITATVAVPEPTVASLAAIGLLGLLVLRRK